MEASTTPDTDTADAPKAARRSRSKSGENGNSPAAKTTPATEGASSSRVVLYDVYEHQEFYTVRIDATGEKQPGERVTLPVSIAEDLNAVNRRAAITQATKDRDAAIDEGKPGSPWGMFATVKSGDRPQDQARRKKVTVEDDWG